MENIKFSKLFKVIKIDQAMGSPMFLPRQVAKRFKIQFISPIWASKLEARAVHRQLSFISWSQPQSQPGDVSLCVYNKLQ